MKAVISFCDTDGDGTVEYDELCAGISEMDDNVYKKALILLRLIPGRVSRFTF